MRNSNRQSLGLRLASASAVLLMTCALAAAPAMAQPDDSAGGDSATPRATPPPSATPAPTPTPAPRPAAAPAAAAAKGGIKDKGLVFQFKLGGNFGVNPADPTGGGGSGWLNGGFMVGYKLNRLTFGLGIEVTYLDYRQTTGDDDKWNAAMVIFSPTIEYYLLVSSPLALYLSAGIHGGFMAIQASPGSDFTNGGVGFHAGMGMRYFMHPRFAIGVEGGFRGIWMFIDGDDSMSDEDEIWGSMSFYGALVLTAIW